MSNLEQFLTKNSACPEGRDWALATGATTCAEIWAREDLKPEWRVWMATRPGVLDHKTLVRFACFCARQNWHLLPDERSRTAIKITEKWLDGSATLDEVRAAAYAAYAAYAAARDAAYAAYAAYAAARDAAYAAAYAAYADDAADARAAQAQWLIENATPNWETEK